jgi:hypothetical protein
MDITTKEWDLILCRHSHKRIHIFDVHLKSFVSVDSDDDYTLDLASSMQRDW